MARPHDIDQEILIQAEAAFFSFWCVFRLCFLANFRFLWNLGSQPETKQLKVMITNKNIKVYPSCSYASWWRAS